MIYLLDTNACICFLNARNPTLVRRVREHGPAEIALCSVVKAELLHGARRSQRVEANLQVLAAFFAPLQSFAFDDESAEHYGRIHADLIGQGKPIGPNDTMIAAIARTHKATLVTHNRREFGRVPALRIEDWEVD